MRKKTVSILNLPLSLILIWLLDLWSARMKESFSRTFEFQPLYFDGIHFLFAAILLIVFWFFAVYDEKSIPIAIGYILVGLILGFWVSLVLSFRLSDYLRLLNKPYLQMAGGFYILTGIANLLQKTNEVRDSTDQ